MEASEPESWSSSSSSEEGERDRAAVRRGRLDGEVVVVDLEGEVVVDFLEGDLLVVRA